MASPAHSSMARTHFHIRWSTYPCLGNASILTKKLKRMPRDWCEKIIDRTATFRSIHNKQRMQDPAILALRSKVVLEAPRGAARGQNGVRPPLLEITLMDGTVLTQDTGPVLGTAENPMSREQLVAKCSGLMSPVMGQGPSSQLIERVLELEKRKDIRELRPVLQWKRKDGPPILAEYPQSK